MFPLFLDLAGKAVAVIGGGAVGRRKARAVHEAGATVRIVDPQPRPEDLDEAIGWVAEPYRPEHLEGAVLVFAAATPEVNSRVAAEAGTRGLWVNSASGPEAGDFFVPATIHRGGLTVAIGTSGAAPALARRLREKWEAELDETFAEWVSLLDEMRHQVRETVPDAAVRRKLLDDFADWPWLERLRESGIVEVRKAMREKLKAAS